MPKSPISLLSILLVALLLTLTSSADDKLVAVVGKWTDGKGTIEFKSDGAALVTPPGDTPMHMKYQIEKSTVILIGRSGKMTFAIVGDALVADGRKFTRTDASKNP